MSIHFGDISEVNGHMTRNGPMEATLEGLRSRQGTNFTFDLHDKKLRCKHGAL